MLRMTTGFLFAAAAVLAGSGPMPLSDPAYWVNIPLNLPEGLIRQLGREPQDGGSVAIELVVDEKGIPTNCIITKPSDDRQEDLRICNDLLKNGRFLAARDEAGVNLPGIWVTRVYWNQVPGGDGHGPPLAPEITFKVNRTIAGNGRAVVGLRQVILADGTIESCATHLSSGDPDLDDMACDLAEAKLDPKPVVDGRGHPSRGVRIRFVGFKSTKR
jgi:hypothetical protein